MKKYKAGIDVGSTTVKMVLLDERNQTCFSRYERHYADIQKAAEKIIKEAQAVIQDQPVALAITGSGGMGLAEVLRIPLSKRSSLVPKQSRQ